MKKYELRKKVIEIRDNNMFKHLSEDDKKWIWDNLYKFHPSRTYSYEDIEWIMPTINKDGYNTRAFLFRTKDGVEDFWSIDKALGNITKEQLKEL